MTPLQIILLFNSLLSGVEALLPKIIELTKSGEITKVEQDLLLARIEAIRSGAAFGGSQWQPDSQ